MRANEHVLQTSMLAITQFMIEDLNISTYELNSTLKYLDRPGNVQSYLYYEDDIETVYQVGEQKYYIYLRQTKYDNIRK